MDWIKSLLFDQDSVAHILALYSFVIAAGVGLGKFKIKGVSLGVACVLFMGILVGHFGFTGNLKIINFIQDFGLILFVYSLGLQVGPSFFTSFRKGGMRMNRLAVEMVMLNIIVAIGAFFLLFDRSNPDSFPMLVGVLSGAVTNTPGLGAAEEACLLGNPYPRPVHDLCQRHLHLHRSRGLPTASAGGVCHRWRSCACGHRVVCSVDAPT